MAVHGVLEHRQMGYLAADPTFRKNGDQKVVNFRVITNISWIDRQSGEEKGRAEGFNYELWGDSAEYFAERMKKGSRVYVEGEPRNDSYEKDGVTHYTQRVNVDKWQALDRQEKSDQSAGGRGADDGAAF